MAKVVDEEFDEDHRLVGNRDVLPFLGPDRRELTSSPSKPPPTNASPSITNSGDLTSFSMLFEQSQWDTTHTHTHTQPHCAPTLAHRGNALTREGRRRRRRSARARAHKPCKMDSAATAAESPRNLLYNRRQKKERVAVRVSK